MSDHQTRYDLQRLLDTGIQPFDDLDAEAFDALRKAIGRGPLAVPLTLTSDGYLIDGHQRARAMLANGRKYVDARDVHVIVEANADNGAEWSVRLNVTRRHLTVEQKAELARRLQRERRWSQAKIAQLFGVSRPAVSQWLAKTRTDDNGGPLVVEGVDGKRYVTEEPPPPPPVDRAPKQPWRPDGVAFAALRKLRKHLEHDDPTGLNPLQAARLSAELADVVELIEGALNQLSEENVDRTVTPDR